MPLHTRARRGFTLVELLVVLAILGLSAVVVSTVRPPRGGEMTRDEVLTRARRLAVQRAQILTLRLERTGPYALIAPASAGAAASDTLMRGDLGPASVDSARTGAMTIDAMGSCHPAGKAPIERRPDGGRFDPLRCRWLMPESAR